MLQKTKSDTYAGFDKDLYQSYVLQNYSPPQ